MTRAILASAILWPLYIGMSLVLQVLGLAILLPLAAGRLWHPRPSKVWPSELVHAWRGGWLTWLWGNEEDGVLGPIWWQQRTDSLWLETPWRRRAWSAYRWSALRNPVNNLRFVPLLNPVIAPARIQFWTTRSPTPQAVSVQLTWQGVYAGLLVLSVIRGHTFRFWLGWKLKPEDTRGVADTDMRKPRCGFAMQFKRVG